MSSVKLIYSDGYALNLGEHVFASVKYKLIRQQLLQERLATPSDFLEPQPATDADVLRVHTEDYVRKLQTGTLTPMEIYRMEIPYSLGLVRGVWLSAGGTILAGRCALE